MTGPRRLVVAVGNPLRRDDGAGPAAAEGLSAQGVRVLVVQQLAPEVAEEVAAADAVVFLDARAGPPAGAVELRRLEPAAAGSSLGHAFSPEEVLALAALLHGARPAAALATVRATDLRLGEGLSPEVAAALPALRAAALRFLRQNSRDQESVSSTSGAFEL